MTTFVQGIEFTVWSCGECGIQQAVTTAAFEERQRTGKDFHCFNGHVRVFRDTLEKRLKRELDRATQVKEAAEARAATAERERAAVTKAHTKMRVRVMNGVCPCCNRTFQNLMGHMKTEHPDFSAPQTLKALRTAFSMTQAAVAEEAGVKPYYVSRYEHGGYIHAHAKRSLDAWVEKHQVAT